jgi:hypothetical protein
MNCNLHSERPASGACTVCGELICEECTVRLGNKRQCKRCLEAAHAPGAIVAQTDQQFGAYGPPPAPMMQPPGAPMQGPPSSYGMQQMYPMQPQGYAPPPQPMIINVMGGASSSSSSSSASASPAIVVIRPRVNHGLHLILSLCTCGLWLPVWIIIALTTR